MIINRAIITNDNTWIFKISKLTFNITSGLTNSSLDDLYIYNKQIKISVLFHLNANKINLLIIQKIIFLLRYN